jgi:predicted PurR-regulated permease PerM
MPDPQKELRWIKYLLIIIALPVVVIILKTLKAIFIPLILAIFLSFIFAPLTAYLKKRRVPMMVVYLVMMVIIVLFFGIVSSLLYAAADSIVNGIPRYHDRGVALANDAISRIRGLTEQTNLALGGMPMLDLTKMLSPGSFSLTKAVSGTMGSLINLLFNLFLILVFLMFLVGGASSLETRLKNALGHEMKDQTLATIANIQSHLQKYLVTKTIISLATALVGAVLMLLFGVDFVLVCAILLFVLNFIPNIGSIIASIIPMLICLLQYGFSWRLVGFAILITATQMLFGNILEPKIQGERLNLTPIMVLISLIFWGWLWGIAGMVLAVPITSAINIILRQIDEKNVVSAIISGT